MKKILVSLFILINIQLSVFSQVNNIQQIVDSIKTNFVPDSRVCIYNINTKNTENVPTICGEISDKLIYDKLILSLKNYTLQYKDSIRLLPDKKIFGDSCWAFVPLSVINISSKPFFAAEIVSQTLMGTPVKLLDKTKYGWFQIQTPDGYIGWTSTELIGITEKQLKEINSKDKIIVTVHNAFVYEKKHKNSPIIADLVMGNLVTLTGKFIANDFCEVLLADGRKGYVNTCEATLFSSWKKTIRLTGDNLVNLSKEFYGLPYFWGGTSTRGLDCSGFTKTMYYMHGIILPRDASQQFLYGESIDTNSGFNKLQKGDLLFFGKKDENDINRSKISHVAMYIGNNQYIHSSNTVHVSSFNSEHVNYDESNHKRFVGAKRFIGVKPNGFWSIFDHEWYK